MTFLHIMYFLNLVQCKLTSSLIRCKSFCALSVRTSMLYSASICIGLCFVCDMWLKSLILTTTKSLLSSSKYNQAHIVTVLCFYLCMFGAFVSIHTLWESVCYMSWWFDFIVSLCSWFPHRRDKNVVTPVKNQGQVWSSHRIVMRVHVLVLQWCFAYIMKVLVFHK